ncbi:MAG: amino acid permease [Proteobacteria bacterium]|nr:amino acid permease [Pseudomonadota bacterium]
MSSKIGFWSVFALVTGSQIGSGVLMLPVNLAPFGILSLVGWLISGLGAIMLALVFANLCSRFPRTGGPHAYVKETFGNTAAFFTGWTYWIISWVSTPIVICASIGYLTPLIGEPSPWVKLALELFLLFVITSINLRGVKAAGSAEFFLTLLKIIPLLIVPIAALSLFDIHHFAKVASMDNTTLSQSLGHVVLLTLWGFIGVESATTPAGSVENPSKTIPRAVVLGTICVALLYFLNSLGIMGAMSANELALSKAPYADTVRLLFSGNWHLVVSLIAAVVCIGTLNAWMLASGQIALGNAQDGLMPAFFAKQNRFGAPQIALIISCLGIVPLLLMTMNESLTQSINIIIDYSVTAFLFVYMICTLALLKLLFQQKGSFLQWTYTLGALSFCGWIIYETPLKTILVSSAFVLSGIPFYFYQRKQKNLHHSNYAPLLESY